MMTFLGAGGIYTLLFVIVVIGAILVAFAKKVK
jgi:hypothetical protein